MFVSLALGLLSFTGASAQRQLTINAKPGAPIQPTMYGIFFEDINFGADGGLYAEMVENRSFEFPQRLMGWNTFGNVSVSEGDKVVRTKPVCPKCGPGVFMATHKDRVSCGNCGYTEFSKKD